MLTYTLIVRLTASPICVLYSGNNYKLASYFFFPGTKKVYLECDSNLYYIPFLKGKKKSFPFRLDKWFSCFPLCDVF